ncbi:hypothetical protein A0H81_05237 [Grifola frondosa]|uniref:Uncharacterized protein n=1 Tax=Grifola frondosa TaxID=5627 RepID=A0A1C7MC20_GRIFR|nr:hypothetical protein A0H81_05237 [Grifola frondosa]
MPSFPPTDNPSAQVLQRASSSTFTFQIHGYTHHTDSSSLVPNLTEFDACKAPMGRWRILVQLPFSVTVTLAHDGDITCDTLIMAGILGQFKLLSRAQASRVEAAEGALGSGHSGSQDEDSSRPDDAAQDGNSSATSGSISPPPSTQPRGIVRTREGSQEREDPLAINIRVVKRLKTHANSLTREYSLPSDAQLMLERFTQLSLPEMLVTLFAQYLRMDANDKLQQIEDNLDSRRFVQIMTRRLWAIVLSPNLPAYVEDFIENVLRFVRKNPDIFKLDQKIFDDPELVDKLSSLISHISTDIRCAVKRALLNGINAGTDLSELVNKFASTGKIEVSLAHWRRVAFLRSALYAFEQLEKKPAIAKPRVSAKSTRASSAEEDNSGSRAGDDPGSRAGDDSGSNSAPQNEVVATDAGDMKAYTSKEFWNYVDDLLSEMRQDAFNQTRERAEEYDAVYTKPFDGDSYE